MDEITIPGRDDANDVFKRFVAQYDAPAYIRRARQVEEAYEHLLERCRVRRDELLGMVRTRLGTLHALAGEWRHLRPCVADEAQLEILTALFAALQPRLRSAPAATASQRAHRRELADLCDSILRFNRRWPEFLDSLDLAPVNALRDGYNRYYLIEKECALRSSRLARQGFKPLAALTGADLARAFPLLSVPRLAR